MHLKTGAVVVAMFVASSGMCSAQESTASPKGDLETMPRWSEFPMIPTDVPTPADIRSRVEALKAEQGRLNAEVAAMQWDPQEPEQIAGQAKQEIASTLPPPIEEAMTPEQLEAFAAATRARATPPPVEPF